MTLFAASGFGILIPVLFALACPLMMIFMMRGHGHGGHSRKSLDELRAERDELNDEIGRRAEGTAMQ